MAKIVYNKNDPLAGLNGEFRLWSIVEFLLDWPMTISTLIGGGLLLRWFISLV